MLPVFTRTPGRVYAACSYSHDRSLCGLYNLLACYATSSLFGLYFYVACIYSHVTWCLCGLYTAYSHASWNLCGLYLLACLAEFMWLVYSLFPSQVEFMWPVFTPKPGCVYVAYIYSHTRRRYRRRFRSLLSLFLSV